MAINYSTDQSYRVEQLRQHVIDYCNKTGENPEIYLSQLNDKVRDLDPAQLKDPVFQTYWQVAYLQLMEVLYPMQVQSLYGEVEEVDFDTLYAATSQDINDFIMTMVTDSPELMAFASMSQGRDDMAKRVLDAIAAQPKPSTSALDEPVDPLTKPDDSDHPFNTPYENTWLREQVDKGGSTGMHGMNGMWDWLIDTEEGKMNAQNFWLGMLAEIDMQTASIADRLKNKEITPEEFEGLQAEAMMSKEFILSNIQNLESAFTNLMELFSNLLKSWEQQELSIMRHFTING